MTICKHIFMLVLCGVSISSFSQDTVSGRGFPRLSVSVAYGTAQPQSLYANATTSVSYPGYARSGNATTAYLTYRFTSWVGLETQFSWGSNGIRENVLANDLTQELIESGYPMSGVYDFKFDKYRWSRMMIGPVLWLHEDEYVVVFRALAGNIRLTRPERQVAISHLDRLTQFYDYPAKDKTLSYLVGAGVEFNMSRDLTLGIQADYFMGRFEYDFRSIFYTRLMSSDDPADKIILEQPGQDRQTMDNLVISLSVTYHILR